MVPLVGDVQSPVRSDGEPASGKSDRDLRRGRGTAVAREARGSCPRDGPDDPGRIDFADALHIHEVDTAIRAERDRRDRLRLRGRRRALVAGGHSGPALRVAQNVVNQPVRRDLPE